jgi:tryptophan synthase alpha chain
MSDAGADIIEIGIPFSDPIADGPVIAAAMHRSLGRGVKLSDVAELVARVRPQVEIGLIAMVSYSIVRRCGEKEFIDQFKEAGIDGFIIPDIDESKALPLSSYCESNGLAFSMLIAPTTPLERVEKLASISSGFLYVLSRTGLTGEQHEMPELSKRLEEIRSVTSLPLAVGFGISTAQHVKSVYESADAAIVGSALVRRMEEADDAVLAASQFVSEISSF